MGDQLMQPQLSRVLGGSCGSIIPHQFLLGVNIPSIHVIEVFLDSKHALVVDFLTIEKW